MLVLKILFWFLAVYSIFLLFAAFTKMKGMIKLAKMKIGKDASDKAAIRFMYISGAALGAGAVVAGLFAFGVL